MSEENAPARIWLQLDLENDQPLEDATWCVGQIEDYDTEYRRADLPPTPSEAMRCPEVIALVEALGDIAGGDPTIDDPEVDAERSARIARAALAALEQAVRHE